MKRSSIFALVATLAAVLSAAAQDDVNGRPFWFDFNIAQHAGLGKWSDTGIGNDGLPGASLTEFRGTFNLRFARRLNGYVDMGFGIMPAPSLKSVTDFKRLPMPNSGTQYYLREVVSESGEQRGSVHFKMGFGLTGAIRATEKLTVLPSVGMGMLSMPRRECELILKEQGTNMQYTAKYRWGTEDFGMYDEEYARAETLGYFAGRLNFRYRLRDGMGLLFGLEYTGFFDTMNFYGSYRNTFNANVQRDMAAEGRRMNMLGVSLGVSFR